MSVRSRLDNYNSSGCVLIVKLRISCEPSGVYNTAVSFAGYSDVSKSWQMTDYDETDIEPMTLRLYERVKPFYQQLHAYVRRRLTDVYRNHGLDPHGPIPAHLLGTGFRNIFSRLYMHRYYSRYNHYFLLSLPSFLSSSSTFSSSSSYSPSFFLLLLLYSPISLYIFFCVIFFSGKRTKILASNFGDPFPQIFRAENLRLQFCDFATLLQI